MTRNLRKTWCSTKNFVSIVSMAWNSRQLSTSWLRLFEYLTLTYGKGWKAESLKSWKKQNHPFWHFNKYSKTLHGWEYLPTFGLTLMVFMYGKYSIHGAYDDSKMLHGSPNQQSKPRSLTTPFGTTSTWLEAPHSPLRPDRGVKDTIEVNLNTWHLPGSHPKRNRESLSTIQDFRCDVY